MDNVYQTLKTFGSVKLNEPLSRHTTFKIGGPADFFISIETTEQLIAALRWLNAEGVDYFILGGGSNMLVSDAGFRGVAVHMADQSCEIVGTRVSAAAGIATVALAQATIKAGLTGFEWGVGVPGTVGGAVRGNAGAMGGEMKDVVETVDILRNGEEISLAKEQCHFHYRESIFKHGSDIVLRVHLGLAYHTDSSPQPLKKALTHLSYRNTTQPQGWASTGCIFKNVDLEGTHGESHRVRLLQHFGAKDQKVQEFLAKEKISAGWLIEQAGLKGKMSGRAQISDRHGNFIINLGGATAADVTALIDEIKENVYDRFGIALEEEIQRV